jgi:hypothetical protein
METLESALRSHLDLARRMLSQGLNGGSAAAGASAVTQPEEDRLRSTVNALERQPEFKALVRRTAEAFSRDEFEKTIGNLWESYVGNFFRRSGWYLKTFGNEEQDKSVEEAYRQAFASHDVTVKYFAPLEFVEFDEDRLDFGQFQVQRLCSQELDEAFDNAVLRVFHPQSEVDSVQLASYWLAHVCHGGL